jgi:lipid II:glycine glycyltransferase (peptidoglycan interpeptide bridge formation enzyme)
MPDPVWQVDVDRATPGEWSSMLDLFYDANLYQTWSYGAVRWGRKNLSYLVLKRNSEVVGMAQLRIIRPTRFNFGMAYLRWGPLCHRRGRDLDREAILYMARALEEEYVFKRGLWLQILPNAFVGSSRAALFQSSFSTFTQEVRTSANSYRTLFLDLTPPIEELRRNLDKKWRNQLTRSEKNGLKIVTGNGVDDYRRFCRMYRQMQQRKAFESTVDIEEFGRLQQDLPETHRMRILICEQEGVPVAGVVASAMGDSAIYLLGATSDDGLNAKGAYLLQWTLIRWLKENGFKWYDLGGIDPEGNPGVYSFKRGMSAADVCQLTPLVACDSVVSSAVVRATLAAHRVVRSLRTLHFGRAFKLKANRVSAIRPAAARAPIAKPTSYVHPPFLSDSGAEIPDGEIR